MGRVSFVIAYCKIQREKINSKNKFDQEKSEMYMQVSDSLEFMAIDYHTKLLNVGFHLETDL